MTDRFLPGMLLLLALELLVLDGLTVPDVLVGAVLLAVVVGEMLR